MKCFLTVHSREKQKMLKDQSPWSSSSALTESVINPSARMTVEAKLSEAEQRFNKNR